MSSTTPILASRRFGRIGLGVLATLALFAIWSIPGFNALRHVLLLLALVLLAARPVLAQVKQAVAANRMSWLWLLLLSLWFVVQAILIAPEPGWSLGELKGQWLTALLAGMVGMLFALHSVTGTSLTRLGATTALMWVLAAEAAISVGISVQHLFVAGELLRNEVPLTGGHLEMSFVLNILLAFITVDLLNRAEGRGRMLSGSVYRIAAILLLAVFCAFLANSRNGIIGLAFLSFSAIALFAVERWKKSGLLIALAGVLAFAVAGTGFAYLNVKTDARWGMIAESAELGWKLVEQPGWLDAPMPNLSTGQPVEISAYVRTSYIHAGLQIIAAHPLGVGYGRNAFGHELKRMGTEQVGGAHVGHAHSGFIDLGISAGIPGLLLWGLFVCSLLVTGWQRYFRHGDPHGLLLLFLTTGYAGRMVLDSVNRDHMLQMFFFLVAYLLTVLKPTTSANPGA